MNDLELRVRDALADRAGRTVINPRSTGWTDDAAVSNGRPDPSRDGRRWVPVTIAAATVAVVVAGLALMAGSDPAPIVPAPATLPSTEPVATTVEPTSAVVPELFPTLADDDPLAAGSSVSEPGYVSFDSPASGRAVVARIERDRVVAPMIISAYADIDESTFTYEGRPQVIDGVTYERHRVSATPTSTYALVLRGKFDLMITGEDPDAFVTAAGGIPVTDTALTDDGGVSFALGPLPDGYETVVEPTTFPFGAAYANLSVGADADSPSNVVIVSGLSDLLLHATNESYSVIDVNGRRGWFGDSVNRVIWQVAPATWATAYSIGDTGVDVVELARRTVFVDEDTWRQTYDVELPDGTRTRG